MSLSFEIIRPAVQTSPVVFSSPHSGRQYDAAFLQGSVLGLAAIRSSEDAFVDHLVAAAPDLGAPLLLAHMPRSYVDLNRAADEFDPALIHGVTGAHGNPRIASGLGVIPRVVSGGRAIYSGKMPMSEAQARIDAHWRPYHRALSQIMDETVQRFGFAILMDMHSMPTEAALPLRHNQISPDVVLGDRHGASAGGQVTTHIETAFAAQGFQVARNSPFAGAYIAQTYGRPSLGRHVVQVEIARGLYMNEAVVTPLPCFDAFAKKITAVMGDVIAAYSVPRALAAE